MLCLTMVLPEIYYAYLSTNQLKSQFNKVASEVLNNEGTHDFKLEIEDAELCPRYIGAVIEDVKVAESPSWLKDRLKSYRTKPD